MGEKKKKEATTKKLKQVLIVGACVLFVVLMIVSGMGSGWISSFAAVKPGDVVVIDYTFYDAIGNPIVTSNQQIYEKAAAGGGILGSKQIQIVANQSLVQSVYPVSVISSAEGTLRQFAIFSPEYDTISSGIVGMKTNEQKRFIISSQPWMTNQWSADQLFEQIRMNITDINVGGSFFLGVSDSQEMAANSTATTYLRVAEVIRKGPTYVVVDFGYPVVDVRVVSINKR